MKFALWLENLENISQVKSGYYYMIEEVRVNPSYQGRKIGKSLYECLLNFMPSHILGIISSQGNKLSTATHVNKIYQSLGGITNIQGKNDTYSVLFNKNTGKIAQIGEVVLENAGIQYKLTALDNQSLQVTAVDSTTGQSVGYISATAFFWDNQKEDFDYEQPINVGNSAADKVGGITLTFKNGRSYKFNLEQTIGNQIIPTDEKRFFSPAQYRLVKQGNQWMVVPLAAINTTFVNNKQISQPTSLKKGDVISIGNPKTGRLVGHATINV